MVPLPSVFISHGSPMHALEAGPAGTAWAALGRRLGKPKAIVINGGDGTVQATLTEIHNGGAFGDDAPPVAVLPNGKTNLIALDLGAQGDPVQALARLDLPALPISDTSSPRCSAETGD